VLAAVDPAVLPLVGVAVGVLGGGIARHYLDTRAEERARERDLKAAARVMFEDLAVAGRTLEGDVSLKSLSDGSAQVALELAAWRETRLVLARLDRETWDALRTAVHATRALRVAHAAAARGDWDRSVEFYGLVGPTRDAVHDAVTALSQAGARGDLPPGMLPTPRWRRWLPQLRRRAD
jgi:hypothetical protein